MSRLLSKITRKHAFLLLWNPVFNTLPLLARLHLKHISNNQVKINLHKDSGLENKIKKNTFKLGFISCHSIYSNCILLEFKKSIKINYLWFLIFFFFMGVGDVVCLLMGARGRGMERQTFFETHPSVKICILESSPTSLSMMQFG